MDDGRRAFDVERRDFFEAWALGFGSPSLDQVGPDGLADFFAEQD
jgi:hypothetical protein